MAGVLTSQLTDHLNELVPQVRVNAVERKAALYNFFDKMFRTGGDGYKWRVNSAGNTSAGSFGESEVEQAAGRQTWAKASLGWKAYRAILRITRFSIEDASGDAYIVAGLVQSELEGAFRDILNSIEDGIYSDGTGNGSLDVTGMQAANSSTGTYAGLNRSTATYWASYLSSSVGALAELDVQTMLLTLRSAARGGNPDTAFCNPTVFNILGNLLDSSVSRTVTQADKGGIHLNGGFSSIDYGGVKVLQIPGYTAQRMDAIQKDEYKMVVIRDFLTDPWERVNDDITTAMSWRGNLVNHHSGHSGALTGISS